MAAATAAATANGSAEIEEKVRNVARGTCSLGTVCLIFWSSSVFTVVSSRINRHENTALQAR
jgi:hypothetical protein